MRVWSVANQKGGVGKTTTAVTIAGLLASWGLPTLLVDIDPHGSLTSYFGMDPDSLDESSYSLFQAAAERRRIDTGSLIINTGTQELDLLPASVALATLDRQAGKLEGMGLVLQKALMGVTDRYDHVLIDCPPVLGMLMVNAVAACERLLIPVQTEFLALKGLERMLHTLEMILKSRSAPLDYTIIPTMYDKRTRASVDSLWALRDKYPEHLWRRMIPIDTKFREASQAGLPPSSFDQNARGVAAYSKLLDDLLAEERLAEQACKQR